MRRKKRSKFVIQNIDFIKACRKMRMRYSKLLKRLKDTL